jgi:ribonuclease P protein component
VAKTTREGFPWHHRIVRSADYKSIYGAGRKLMSENFVLFGRENSLSHHRLGITVSRKVGGAVVRNRIKRLLREIFRKSSSEIPHHFDFVVNVKSACAAAPFSRLREEFISAARRLCE